jgi:hypothetical protein
VTWLANANLAATKSFCVRGISPDGSVSGTRAQEWIAAMNAANYLGSNQSLGHLYYHELGGAEAAPPSCSIVPFIA